MTAADPGAPARPLEGVPFAWTPERFNRRVQDVPTLLRAGPGEPGVISLAFGAPDPALFPAEGLRLAAERALRDPAACSVALQYGQALGNPVLLEALGEKLRREEGRPVQPGSLCVTSGSSQAIALAVQVLANPGDTCLIEAPTFLGAVRHIRFHQVAAVPVPLDEGGLDLEALETALRRLDAQGVRPRFLYTIPTFHNPAGVTMSLERRRALLDLAARHDLPVVEDDAYGDLRYEGAPVPTLHALDRTGLVVRVGTLSKVVAPGVRLGFLWADPAVIQRLAPFKAEGATNGLAALVVGTFLQSEGWDAHLRHLREAYRTRRDAMYEALAAELPPEVRWTRAEGGFFTWLTLPPPGDGERILRRAEAEGVLPLPGTACFADGGGRAHLRLAWSLHPPERLREGVRRLGRAIRAELGAG